MALSKVPILELSDAGKLHPSSNTLNSHISNLNKSLNQLNRVIDIYNSNQPPEAKKALLSFMQKTIKRIDNSQNNMILAFCPDYFANVHGILFKEIQQEQQDLGLVSQPAPDANITLSELIATMAPEKTQQMTDILSQRNVSNVHKQLKSLYKKGDPGKEVYDKFLKNHHIKFLGGNNSKNFLVENTTTGAKQIIKVENRLGAPKQVESELRDHALSSVLMPVHAERQVMYTHANARIGLSSGSLQVVDYSSGQDLEKFCSDIPRSSEKTKKVLPHYQRMAEVLLAMQDQNCAFPDMKGSNWLVDEKGELRMADGKSFIKLNGQGEVKRNEGFAHTPYMLAPEMKGAANFSADAMHTYLLGKNLYHNLTGCRYGMLSYYTDESNFDYSSPVFSTDIGIVTQDLLSGMLNVDPAKRPPLAQVQLALQLINNHPEKAIEAHKTKVKCQALLEKISSAAGLSSPIVKRMQERLEAAVNPQDYDAIHKDSKTYSEQVTKIKDTESYFLDWLKNNNINEKELGIDISGYISSATQMLGEIDSMDDLLALEEVVNHPHLKDIFECMNDIKKHEFTQFGVKDVAMDQYITKVLQDVDQVLSSTEDIPDFDKIYHDVKGMKKALEQSQPITDDIRDLVNQKKFFMSSKGKRILNALVEIPLTERQHIPESKSKEAQLVLSEMASSRILPQAMSSRTPEKNPATMFKAFKEKHQKTIETQENKEAKNELKDALNNLEQETPSDDQNKNSKYDTIDNDEVPDSPTPK